MFGVIVHLCHVRRIEETKAQRDMNTPSIFNEERTLKQTNKKNNPNLPLYNKSAETGNYT